MESISETWRPVAGILKGEPYEVSDKGRVRQRGGRLLSPYRTPNGYLQVNFRRKEGRKQVLSLHRIVADAFLATISGKSHVNHKDGNKHNCSVANLEWCSPLENTRHAITTGLWKNTGENSPVAKLTDETAREIYRRYASGEKSRDVAADFGVNYSTVQNIAKGKTWRHLGLQPLRGKSRRHYIPAKV